MLLFVDTIGIIFYVLGVLIALLVLGLLIYKWYINIVYRRAKRKKVDLPIKASELARANLDKAGLADIEVVIKTFKVGYSFRRKKLFISKAMERRTSIYSVSKVMQLVSLAILNNTDEKFRKTSVLSTAFSWGAGALFFAMIIVSIITLFATTTGSSTITLITLIIAMIFYAGATIISIKKGNMLKKANSDALVYIDNLDIFDEKDVIQIKKIYDLSIKEYNINKILAVVYFIYYFLKVLYELSKIFGKK